MKNTENIIAKLNPYPGLNPFSIREKDYFFARETEADDLTALIRAKRLVLFFAGSGVGKSSLINAGVIPMIRKEEFGGYHSAVIRMFEAEGLGLQTDQHVNYGTKFSSALGTELLLRESDGFENFTLEEENDKRIEISRNSEVRDNSGDNIEHSIKYWLSKFGRFVIFLDQFEEFFLQPGREEKQADFLRQLHLIQSSHDLRVRLVISMRSDFISHFEQFIDSISGIYENRLLLAPLTASQAVKAIESPVKKINEQIRGNSSADVSFENIVLNTEQNPFPDREEEVSGKMKNGFIEKHGDLGLVGQILWDMGGVKDIIHAPSLQIVCKKLWNTEQEKWTKTNGREGRFLISNETYRNELKGCQSIITEYITDIFSSVFKFYEKGKASRIIDQMVTPAGTRNRVHSHSLYNYVYKRETGLKVDESSRRYTKLKEKLVSLVDARLLTHLKNDQGEWYEPSHDQIAVYFMRWNRKYARKFNLTLLIVSILLITPLLFISVFSYAKYKNTYIEIKLKKRIEALNKIESNKTLSEGTDTSKEKNDEDLQEILEELTKDIGSSKKTSLDWFAEGNDAYNEKEDKKAIEAYKKAIELNPEHAIAYNNMGVAYRNIKEYSRSIEAYQKAIKLKPDYADAYQNMGNTYRDMKEYSSAIEAYKNMGNAYRKQKEYSKAIDAYNKAIELNPDYADAYYNMGIVYRKQNKYSSAIEAYQKAIELNPDYANAYKNMGRAYSDIKEYSSAIEAYKKAIELNPKYANAYNGLAWLYATAEDESFFKPDDALHNINKAIELAGKKNTNFLDTLARVYYLNGSYNDAWNTLQEILKKEPDYYDDIKSEAYLLTYKPIMEAYEKGLIK